MHRKKVGSFGESINDYPNGIMLMRCVGKMKLPPIREDLKVLIYQSQEADNTFITTDGTSPYNSSR
jgi:hypothetical protein